MMLRRGGDGAAMMLRCWLRCGGDEAAMVLWFCGAASMRRLRVAMVVVKVRPFGCDAAVLYCSGGSDAVRWASLSNKKGPDSLTRPAGVVLLRSCCVVGCGVSMRYFGDLAVVAR